MFYFHIILTFHFLFMTLSRSFIVAKNGATIFPSQHKTRLMTCQFVCKHWWGGANFRGKTPLCAREEKKNDGSKILILKQSLFFLLTIKILLTHCNV